MPELPEVETIVRTLRPVLTGRRVLSAAFPGPRALRGAPPPDLAGMVVETVRRHGKFIVVGTNGGLLVIHLGMTGKLLFDAEPGPYARAVFELDEGHRLVYDDIRQFGCVEWHRAGVPRFGRLGPDPLEIGEVEFIAGLRARRAPVKAILLDQSFVRGIGNIYADEALFRARVHPRTRGVRLAAHRARSLFTAAREVLETAIRHRGSSISDYVDAGGNRGGFQLLHNVYGREAQPCRVCGTPIRRIVVAQRGTHYCPACQKR
ncbi:MAG: bifunctional DNA-formamidopyrimidine glycosylase/DNA-(apurinic or apyrimidinic site) lyase [Bryobacteraceae bacterium]|nr:bifunctional DNA-formamidopyrimidine glycosylase/DNA-(apurinic or apyrimidinic site) lyase [Bryobacteraceae bacterium]